MADGPLGAIRTWSSGYSLIDPARVSGMVRFCMELEPYFPDALIDTAKLCLLVCALDDAVDRPTGLPPATRDALLVSLIRDLQTPPESTPGDEEPSWAIVRRAIRDFCRQGGDAFAGEWCEMLRAMREEVRWLSTGWPCLEEYLDVGWRTVATPAVYTWLAVHAGVALDDRAICRELLKETGLALRLANDLSDRGREANEGKPNAVFVLRDVDGYPEEEARALLEQRADAHLRCARDLVRRMPPELERWAQAALGMSVFLFDAYRARGDFVDRMSSAR